LKFSLLKIYPITDRKLSGLSHADQVRQFALGGATLVQLRDKSASSGDLYESALEAVNAANEHGIKLLINDRVDIALMAGAHGVHLGQTDLPAREARKLLGTEAIIGLSTHTIEQARIAVSEGIADYLAFGPIFKTDTKLDHDPLVGTEGLKAIRVVVGDIPLVAIGGIKRANLASVLASGADSVAMISEFYKRQSSLSESFSDLLKIADNDNLVKRS